MKRALLFLGLFFSILGNSLQAQTTIITATTTNNSFGDLVYAAATGGAFVFGIRNTNVYPVAITDLANPTETGVNADYTLWYKPAPLTGAPGAITAANGWTQIAGPFTLTAATPTGLTPMFSGINFQIPANTTYRFAIVGAGGNSPYYTQSGLGPNIFAADGIEVISQNNPLSPGYGGAVTGPGNTPRGFAGRLTFTAIASACTNPPIAGTAESTPSAVCAGSSVNLSLTGSSIATGLSYQWQSSPTLAGTYTDVSAALLSPGFTTTITSSTYFRCAVSCGANPPVYSTPVLVTVNPPLAANTYTINQTQATGGTNFNNFTDAFNALACGIAGKVIFNVSPDQTFTENPPELNITGTVTDSIIFRKWGAGANPVIMPMNPGTIASSTTLGANGDAVIIINGGDYITFDAIDINTSNFASGADMYEYGYYLKKKSATDASKNVTIKNSVISLSKGIYSFGIHVSNNSGTAAVTVSSTGGASENIKISGNTINNSYGGILVRGQATAAYYDQNIEIGVDSGNVITDFAGGGTTAYGIYVIGQNNVKIANNTVTSVITGHTTTLYGIYTGTSTNANVDIYHNTVTITGSGTTASIYAINNAAGGTGTNNTVKIYNNTITGCNYTTATTGDLYLINQDATAFNLEISGNTLSNNTLAGTSATFYQLYQSVAVVNQSRIFNNSITGNSKTAGTTGVTYCIYNTGAATSNNQIYNNVIDNIAVTNTSGSLTGIHVVTGATNAVYNNKISGLINTASTTGAVYGITLASGGVINNVYNNMIVDLNAPTSTNTGTTTTDLVRGINITSATANSTQNVSFNTILLNASGGANFSSSGVFHTTSATATTSVLNLRSNIIVNHSNASGTGYASAYRRSSANVLANYGSASNNNLFHVNSTSNQVVYYDGTNNDADLATFKTRVTPRETASISQDPNFINGFSAPYDLHIDPAIPTQIESGATPVTGITTDIDGQARNATTPDIGADEFAGTTTDLTAPTIMYTAVPVKSICVDSKTISATITDAANVNVAAGTKPRLWFKKATEADVLPATNTSASNGWKYVEASNATSPFTFTFNYSLLTSPLAPGDSVSYFIVAQDLAATPNVGSGIAIFNTTPATVALSAGAFPVSGNINGFSILPLPSITIKANTTDVCASGTVRLNVDNVDVTGGEYQWQSSTHGTNAWTDMPGGTTLSFVTPVLTDTTDFRLVVKCGGVAVTASPSNVIVVNVNNPQLVSTTGATRCGIGTVNLQATPGSGLYVKWYETPTAQLPLYTGNSFTTPVINGTKTFYAAASTSPADSDTITIGAGATTSATYSNPFYSLWSNTHTQHIILASELNAANIFAGKITSVALNVTAAGTLPMIDFSLKIGTTTAPDMSAFVSTAFSTVYTSPSLMPVAGINTLVFSAPFEWDGTSNIVLEFCHGNPSSGATMSRTVLADATSYVSSIKTHTSAGTAASVQCPNLTTNLLTYSVRPQFRFSYEPGCVGTRMPVVATVTAPPVLTTMGSKVICNNTVDSLEVTTGGSDFDTFIWSPVTNLFTDAAATVPYTGGSALKLYVKSGTFSKTGYTVTSTNTTTSCANAVTDTVIVLPNPVINATKNDICYSGSSVLSLDASLLNGSTNIQWQSSTDGINYTDISGANGITSYTTPTLTSTTYYKALVRGSNGTACSQPTITITVNSPSLTATGGMNCGAGSVVLNASGTGDIKWYAASTGGVPIATGSTFNTPVITATTTYYASITSGGGGVASVGPAATASTTGYTGLAGLNFNALMPFTLTGVYVYPLGTGTGDVVIALQDAAQVNLQTVTVNLTGSSSPVKTFVPLNFSVPAGTGLSLVMLSRSGGVASLARDLTATTVGGFPFTLPGVVSITQGRLGAGGNEGVYYFFYDWQITTGCESPRVPVVATINNNPGCGLPVTFLSFRGEKQNNYNKLSWSTATEINNSGFELQRSIDGNNFSPLTFVSSKADNGNSSAVLNYGFDDKLPLKGYNYYRLKQVDRDGRSAYSNVVAIRGEKVNTVQVLTIYPNPVKDVLNLKIEAPQRQGATLVITDAIGQVVMQKQMQLQAGESQLQLNASQLAQGAYFVKLTSSDGHQLSVYKFIKE